MRAKFTLKDWMYIRRMSVPQLAHKSKLNYRTIQYYISDEKHLQRAIYSNIASMAKALNVKVEDIYIDPDVDTKRKLSSYLDSKY
ncbi:XRE family transcriptional regulator [Apilactobacillus micheneri]|uniref:XRE family transcriptional regulator n=2 Tax=Apilactobacillus micheneri TaxID=1899430 RepID=A0ABY2YWC9_9LACO|nr:XRE family transcriptional regulator [Apilactobacillus micheneri]TPR24434.1 XRE family transcriptional regulator [Apilactobacillus micheneri]TPR29381.1 XRE family transcriptional regulator [Apilactobacillus micheneri]TPR34588.1 XRE family transcriptional regulator [Apilactobacillus micheneri]